MAKAKEKAKLEKKNWVSQFTLIGEARINDYTYKLDAKADQSDWIYNSMNLGVYCGDKHGTVYAELMGGYGAERQNVLYVHGVKEEGGKRKDDFDNRFTIDWDDRFDEAILETIGDMCFITVGLEVDTRDKVVTKKFLSPYDAIQYISENLENGTVINVKGNLRYSIYKDAVQVRKEITSIYLSKVDSPDKYRANFTQTMLLTKDSVGKPDLEKGIIPVYAKVLEYFKTFNNKEVKQFIPLNKTFEFDISKYANDKAKIAKAIDKVLKVRKGVTEITFEGDLIEGGALITATEDDLPDDVKDLISIGVYTLEEALAKCTDSTSRERRMVIVKPAMKLQGEDDNKKLVIQQFHEKYTEEDLMLDCLMNDEEEEEETDDDTPLFDTESNDDDEDWLSKL